MPTLERHSILGLGVFAFLLRGWERVTPYSCGAQKNRRASLILDFFDRGANPCSLASATGGGRRGCSSRTRQLSSPALTILGRQRPGKISRCQHSKDTQSFRIGCLCFLWIMKCGDEDGSWHSSRPLPAQRTLLYTANLS